MDAQINSGNPNTIPRDMRLKELQSVVTKNMNDLKSYLQFLQIQQQALIRSNAAELEESVINQEKILISIDQNQNLTAELLKDFISENKLQLKTPGMKGFLESIKDIYRKEYENLTSVRETIAELVNKIIETNRRNKILIDHSRNFIKEILGALSNPAKPVLDKKI